MPKRRRGASWRIRENSIQLMYNLGKDVTGKHITRSVTIPRINPETGRQFSERQIKQIYMEHYAEAHVEKIKPSSTTTVYEMCKDVMEQKIEPHKKAKTVSSYKTILGRVQTTIGDYIAAKMTPRQVQEWVNYLTDEYHNDKASYSDKKKGLAPKTVRGTYSFLSMCYKTYMNWELMEASPCRNIEFPPANKKEPFSYNADQLVAFLTAMDNMPARDIDYKIAYLLAMFTGLREAELTGIDVDSVDMETCTIVVNKTREMVAGELIEDTTKTKDSVTTIVYPKEMNADLKKLDAFHKMRKLQLGPHWIEQPSLLKGRDGRHMSNSNLWKYLNKFLIENDLAHISVHGLRHTYVSMLYSFGNTLTEISNQARHANKSTTLNVYSHLFMDADQLKKENANMISSLYLSSNLSSK